MAQLSKLDPGSPWPRGIEYGKKSLPAFIIEGIYFPDCYAKMTIKPSHFATFFQECNQMLSDEYGFCHVSGKAFFVNYDDAVLFLLTWC
jgi:hypothetical protein